MKIYLKPFPIAIKTKKSSNFINLELFKYIWSKFKEVRKMLLSIKVFLFSKYLMVILLMCFQYKFNQLDEFVLYCYN